MLSFLLKFVVTAVLVYGLAQVLPGVELGGIGSAALLLVVLGILNAVVKPVLSLLSLPITVLTLGLFALVINVIIIWLADKLMDSFNVHGFLNTFLFSIGLALVNAVVGMIFDKD